MNAERFSESPGTDTDPSNFLAELPLRLDVDESWCDMVSEAYGRRSRVDVNVRHWLEPKRDEQGKQVLRRGQPDYEPRHHIYGQQGAQLQGKVVGVKIVSAWHSAHPKLPVLELTNVYKIEDGQKQPLQRYSNDHILIPFTALGQKLSLLPH
jgi:hypothetical protein